MNLLPATQRLGRTALLTAIGLSAGCSSPPQAPPSSNSTQQASAVSSAPSLGGHLVAQLLRASLDQIQLRADQKASLEALRDDVRAKSEPVKQAGQQLARTLVESVARASADRTGIDAQIDKLAAAVQANEPVLQDAANKLHATLDRTQRKQLVEIMREKGQQWREHARTDRQEGRGVLRERMQRLAQDLQLSSEQQGVIRDRMRAQMNPEAMRAARSRLDQMQTHMKAIGDAFQSDSFDARALGVGANAPEITRLFADRIARFVLTLQPLLTPEQRVHLAQIIRDRAHDVDFDSEPSDGD
jgi:Spy/CpxP family protein refolding chaperone